MASGKYPRLQLLQLVWMAQEGEQAIADQIGGRFLASHHGENGIGNNLLLAQAVAVHFGSDQGADEAFAGVFRCSARLPGSRRSSPLSCAAPAGAVGVVLEVAQHLGKDPRTTGSKLLPVSRRQAAAFRH